MRNINEIKTNFHELIELIDIVNNYGVDVAMLYGGGKNNDTLYLKHPTDRNAPSELNHHAWFRKKGPHLYRLMLKKRNPESKTGHSKYFDRVFSSPEEMVLCDDFRKFFGLSGDQEMPNPAEVGSFKEQPNGTKSKNIILYGPPGTGKTYKTIDEALAILDPEYLANNKADRNNLKVRFDELYDEGKVRFVTFHQSFSYEDFVEGLRAKSDGGHLSYPVESGIFKEICEHARYANTDGEDVFETAVEQLAKHCEESNSRPMLQTVTGKRFEIEFEGGKTFRVFPQSSQQENPYYVASLDNVRRLYQGESKKTMYNPSYVEGMLNYLRQECGLPMSPPSVPSGALKPKFVLIIDEINRGNISRIFGELITLIEPSKRAGDDPNLETLHVTLPYSKERFSVPDNVYLIGTMNTADRSLAALDIALRRRFSFKEMPPRPDLLDEVTINDTQINVGRMLRVMNQRISVLLDSDHCLGHAYFMALKNYPKLENLAAIFRQNVLPLLQEYFFEDWQRIRWVLNDHRKNNSDTQFICEDKSLGVSQLFGNVAELGQGQTCWKLNQHAFVLPASYEYIGQAEPVPEESAGANE